MANLVRIPFQKKLIIGVREIDKVYKVLNNEKIKKKLRKELVFAYTIEK